MRRGNGSDEFDGRESTLSPFLLSLSLFDPSNQSADSRPSF